MIDFKKKIHSGVISFAKWASKVMGYDKDFAADIAPMPRSKLTAMHYLASRFKRLKIGD